MQLDSMTPLSCSLFAVLGISKDNALQAATLARSMGLTAASSLTTWLTAYMTVVRHQVSHSEDQLVRLTLPATQLACPHSMLACTQSCTLSVTLLPSWEQHHEDTQHTRLPDSP
jgi:hypothetical protein